MGCFVCLKVLLMYKGKGFCGGVIYKPTWILTASHCMEKMEVQFLKVAAGKHLETGGLTVNMITELPRILLSVR